MTITCLKCQNVIGEITVAENGIVDFLQENGLLSVRKRLDGHLGFECRCGNDSRISKQEKGIIMKDGKRPLPKHIEEIAGNVAADPTTPEQVAAGVILDNFLMEV